MVQLRNKKETNSTKPIEKKAKKTKSKTIRQILEENENQLNEQLVNLKISETELTVVVPDRNEDSGLNETSYYAQLNETSKQNEQITIKPTSHTANEESRSSDIMQDAYELSHHSESSMSDQSFLRLNELTSLVKTMMKQSALSTFSGKHDEDFDDWVFAMERHFKKANVPLEQQADLAVDYLRGNARSLYRNIANFEKLTWIELKDMLGTNFVPKNIQNLLRTQLRELKQTSCLEEYIYSFDALMSKVKDMSEFDKVLYFTDGLKGELKQRMSQKSPGNLFEAKNLALKEHIIILGREVRNKKEENRDWKSSRKQSYNNHKTKCYYSKEFKRNSNASREATGINKDGYNLRKAKVSIESQTDSFQIDK
jgi:hypothetical protein